MVNIRFLKSSYGFEEAEFNNHAGDTKVCNAVSALGCTLVATLDHFGAVYRQREINEASIIVKIEPFLDDEKQTELHTAFTTIYIGLIGIMRKHPKNIKIEEEFV